MKQALSSSAAVGIRWGALNSAVAVLLRFLQIAVLARILSPEDFGTAAIVVAILAYAQVVGEFGLGASIVQQDSVSRTETSTLFWLQILFGLLVFGGTTLGATIWMGLSPASELPSLLAWAAVGLVTSSIGTVPAALVQRDLQFRRQNIAEMLSVLSGVVVAIVSAALLEQGVWALIWGNLATTTTKSLILVEYAWRVHRVPAPMVAPRLCVGHLGFGLYLTGAKLLNTVGARSDTLIIGTLLGTQAVGYYSIASSLVLLPWQRINPILTRVAFPVFARAKNQPKRVVNGYLRMVRIIFQTNAPLLLGLAVVAPLVVPLYLGQNWQPAIPLVQILAFVGLFRTLGNAGGVYMLAFGNAKALFRWELFILATLPLATALACGFDNVLVVASVLAVLQPMYIVGQYFFLVSRPAGPFGARYLRALVPATASVSVMSCLLLVLFDGPPGRGAAEQLGDLTAQVGVGALVYISCLLMLDRRSILDDIGLLTSRSN